MSDATMPGRVVEALDAEFRNACTCIQVDQPWFGAFSLSEGGTVRQYRVGKHRNIDLRIIPWQHPYARAFFEGRVGAHFEVDADQCIGYRPLSAELDVRARVTTKARRLERVELEQRSGTSSWVQIRGPELAWRAGGGNGSWVI